LAAILPSTLRKIYPKLKKVSPGGLQVTLAGLRNETRPLEMIYHEIWYITRIKVLRYGDSLGAVNAATMSQTETPTVPAEKAAKKGMVGLIFL
jgi:hypothetical protein